jgi:hypothetical protein
MAVITITLSAEMAAKSHFNEGYGWRLHDFATRVLFDVAVFDNSHKTASASSSTGNDRLMTYADGSTTTLKGFVTGTPGTASGSATATAMQSNDVLGISLAREGQLAFTATTNGQNVSSYAPAAMQYTLLDVQRNFPQGDPVLYNPTTGNTHGILKGDVQVSAAGQVTGSLASLEYGEQVTYESIRVTGEFAVSGDMQAILLDPKVNAKLSGRLDGFVARFTDGSLISMQELNLAVDDQQLVGENLLTVGANLPGDDFIDITVPDLQDVLIIDSGAGNDRVMLAGGNGRLGATTGSGNDLIVLWDLGHVVDGGAGQDVAHLFVDKTGHSFRKDASGFNQLFAGETQVLSLKDVERVHFNDVTVAFEAEGVAGQAYRLYEAAFNRRPDEGGLGFWIDKMDEGLPLDAVAGYFVESKEFIDTYGSSLNNTELITLFYKNIHGRTPDPGGLAFWVGVLDEKRATVAEVLADISESPENKANVAELIGQGITYIGYLD